MNDNKVRDMCERPLHNYTNLGMYILQKLNEDDNM